MARWLEQSGNHVKPRRVAQPFSGYPAARRQQREQRGARLLEFLPQGQRRGARIGAPGIDAEERLQAGLHHGRHFVDPARRQLPSPRLGDADEGGVIAHLRGDRLGLQPGERGNDIRRGVQRRPFRVREVLDGPAGAGRLAGHERWRDGAHPADLG
jgi:hypothetical protein